jgi:hypothetical protein
MTNTQQDETESGQPVKISAENLPIMDKVDYVYVTYAQFAVNSMDMRIAFGDRLPPDGRVKPVIGLTLPHDVAKSFLKAMAEAVPKIDMLLERMQETSKQQTIEAPIDKQ